MIKAVIMAGGTGTRLWPLSRAQYPKQFLTLDGGDTMLRATAKRLGTLGVDSSIIICNEEHRFLVAEQMRSIGKSHSIILEPEPKNTAPAVALAALESRVNDPLLLVLAADHVIQDTEAFAKSVSEAIPLAESGKLVTFGVVPNGPNTEYGYIKQGKEQKAGFLVEKFAEKPSLELAIEYFTSNEYYWNSGMFLFRSSKYLDELRKFRPDIYKACELATKENKTDLDFTIIDREEFGRCPSESIDYAVMENTLDAVVVPIDVGWSDIGSWSSLWELSDKDEKGNVVVGDVLLRSSKDSYIRSDDKLTVALGVDDLVIVSTKDALMVAHKDRVQEAKIIAQQLKDNDRREWELHREVNRPWGKYDSVDNGDGFQVKRITVNPGEKLSLQMHHKRSEHWIVVSGIAKVTKGDDTFLLSQGQATYIPLECVHSLENPGEVPLELIEVQIGIYLGEDDIVRLEDRYGRT